MDDLQKLGAVIDAAGGSGATSMSGLQFDLKDRAAAPSAGTAAPAVRDAMARARALASGAQVTLGESCGLRTPTVRQPMPYDDARRIRCPGADAGESGGWKSTQVAVSVRSADLGGVVSSRPNVRQ